MRREIPAIVAVVAGPWLAGVGGGVLFSSQVTQPSAATVRVSASRIIDQDFANASAEGAFKVIRGGGWVARGYRYSLAHPTSQPIGVGNANIVVLQRVMSGGWKLSVRIAARGARSGRVGFSVIFGFRSADSYFYVNLSDKAMTGTNGIFQVAGRRRRELARFVGRAPLVAPGRDYNVSVIESGTTASVQDGRVLLATVQDQSLGRPGRLGLGSQGSQLWARRLEVWALSPRIRATPSPSGSGTEIPLSPSPSPAPPTPSTPTPTPESAPPPPASGDLATFFGRDFSPSAAFCTFQDQFVSMSAGDLTVTYPAGSTAPSMGPPYGGAQICEPFASGPQTSATLTYQIRFPVGFQFVKGGKLPGVYGGVEPFSGGGHNPNGWSMRLMWQAGGAGEIYAYISGVNGYGLDLGRGDFTWPADGLWHTVSLKVVVNSPGQSNGEAVLSLDGRVVVDATGLAVTDTATPISGLFFSTFYGGHDPSWAPTANMQLAFAEFSAN